MLDLDTNLTQVVRDLHEEYFLQGNVDGKPEKGERKIADEFILLINEILDERENSQGVDHWTLYRIGMLEYGLERSPYNFDIQYALVRLYDS